MRWAGIQSEAVFEFIVERNSSVQSAVVLRANDVPFGEAARAAILGRKFELAKLNGVPVPCRMQVPSVFT